MALISGPRRYVRKHVSTFDIKPREGVSIGARLIFIHKLGDR